MDYRFSSRNAIDSLSDHHPFDTLHSVWGGILCADAKCTPLGSYLDGAQNSEVCDRLASTAGMVRTTAPIPAITTWRRISTTPFRFCSHSDESADRSPGTPGWQASTNSYAMIEKARVSNPQTLFTKSVVPVLRRFNAFSKHWSFGWKPQALAMGGCPLRLIQMAYRADYFHRAELSLVLECHTRPSHTANMGGIRIDRLTPTTVRDGVIHGIRPTFR